MAIHNPIHKRPPLARGVLPSQDHAVVITGARWPPRRHTPTRKKKKNRWPDILTAPPANDQKMGQLEANIQGLMGAVLERLFPESELV